jgi:hypothetical protein
VQNDALHATSSIFTSLLGNARELNVQTRNAAIELDTIYTYKENVNSISPKDNNVSDGFTQALLDFLTDY